MNKIVAIDMDDVLVDLLRTWVSELNKKYNLEVKFEDINEWDMLIHFPTLTFEQIHSILREDEFWEKVPAVKDGIDVVHDFLQCGYKVVVVTASHYETIKSKIEKCLLRYYGHLLSWEDVIVCQDKSLIKCDYMIDDSPLNLANQTCIRILMWAPHNRWAPDNTYDFKVWNLREAFKIIHEG